MLLDDLKPFIFLEERKKLKNKNYRESKIFTQITSAH